MANSQKHTLKKKANVLKKNTTAESRVKLFSLAGIVALITFLCFYPALKNGFINWDDNAYVFDNRHLDRSFWELITHFFGPNYFIGNYIPVTMMVYAIQYKLAGLNPSVYHAVNLFIHLFNVLLVFWFIFLLSNKKFPVAFLVSLFFGIHPMHVESVVWIAELKDVLYSFFFLAGLIAYFRYIEKNYRAAEQIPANPDSGIQSFKNKKILRSLLPVLIFFLLSVLSKPAAIIFPLVLLLMDFYVKRKFDKWLWIEKTPFFIVSVFFGFIALISQGADGLLRGEYTLFERVLFAAHSFLVYIFKFFAPLNLSIFYPFPKQTDGFLPVLYYVAPVFVLVLFYGIYKTLKHTRLVVFGFLFFLVNLLLVLQLIPFGDAIMADRYTYIPYIGLLFILAMGFHKLYYAGVSKQQSYRTAAVALLVFSAVTCAYQTFSRSKIWKNDYTIATDFLNKFPDDEIALNNKGYVLYEMQKYEEAIPLYKKAIELKPDYVRPYINLSNLYQTMNNYDGALSVTEEGLKHSPASYYLLIKKGYLLFSKGIYSEATTYFQTAILLKKQQVEAYLYLVECYYATGDIENTVKTIDEGLMYEPKNHILLNNKGYIYFKQGDYSEAVNYYQASLAARPDYRTASVNLSNCYAAMKDTVKKN